MSQRQEDTREVVTDLYGTAIKALAGVAANSRAWRELGAGGPKTVAGASRVLQEAKDRVGERQVVSRDGPGRGAGDDVRAGSTESRRPDGKPASHSPSQAEVQDCSGTADCKCPYCACPTCGVSFDQSPAEPQGDVVEVRQAFFDALDERVRARQLQVEPEGVPTLHVADVHAALDSFLAAITPLLRSSIEAELLSQSVAEWAEGRRSSYALEVRERLERLARELEEAAEDHRGGASPWNQGMADAKEEAAQRVLAALDKGGPR